MSEASDFQPELLRVGQLAARTGVSPRLLRYYDNQGLLTARRSASGQRLFEAAAVQTVRSIRGLLAAGLPTRVIRELLDCIHEPGRIEPCAVPTLVDHLDGYDQRIADLVSTRVALQDLIDASTSSTNPAAT